MLVRVLLREEDQYPLFFFPFFILFILFILFIILFALFTGVSRHEGPGVREAHLRALQDGEEEGKGVRRVQEEPKGKQASTEARNRSASSPIPCVCGGGSHPMDGWSEGRKCGCVACLVFWRWHLTRVSYSYRSTSRGRVSMLWPSLRRRRQCPTGRFLLPCPTRKQPLSSITYQTSPKSMPLFGKTCAEPPLGDRPSGRACGARGFTGRREGGPPLLGHDGHQLCNIPCCFIVIFILDGNRSRNSSSSSI